MSAAPDPKQLRIALSSDSQNAAPPESLGPLPENWWEIATRVWRSRLRGFARVPTHTVGVVGEKRAYPRAALGLPLRLKRVAGQAEPKPVNLLTKNISSSGVYFLCPLRIEPGTPIELEVALVERPLGQGSVRMATVARVVRVEPTDTPGWHGLAASFDDITFHRDEPVPPQ